ncbi:MAG: hypothetical protein KDA47_20825 [Planctomycetales bacterium]|nr:hypothetical protein [Planctomycetales bacterium]
MKLKHDGDVQLADDMATNQALNPDYDENLLNTLGGIMNGHAIAVRMIYFYFTPEQLKTLRATQVTGK